jgi:hypothetical protein
MSDVDRDRVSTFLFHLGKGIWKSIPVLGPIIEEVVYAQFEDQLKAKMVAMPDDEVQSLAQALPTVDFTELEHRINALSDDTKLASLSQFARVLADLHTNHTEVMDRLNEARDHLAHLPTMVSMLDHLRAVASNRQALEQALAKYEDVRRQWINRLSRNQQLLLRHIPVDYVAIDELWRLTLQIIPACGYKEFRLRLHELEWLGLVERIRCVEAAWKYRRLPSESEASNAT